MGISLTLIDHHFLPDQHFIRNPKVKVIFGFDQDNFFKQAAPFVNKKYDYLFTDENPDAFISSILYLLSQKKKPQFKCLPRALTNKDIKRLEDGGKKNILFLNCLWAYESDFDNVDEITLINPYESGMPNLSVAHILYRSLENSTTFMRDLTGISVAMDYTIDEAFEIIVEIARAYPDILEDVVQMIDSMTLNKYNIGQTSFGNITSLFHAPAVLQGIKGVDKMIKLFSETESFGLNELMSDSNAESALFLRSSEAKYQEILNKELENFENEKQVNGVIISYAPHFKSQNFVREFSNIIKDNNIDSVIMIKQPVEHGKTKYSIRRGELNVDLGALLKSMNVGGGNPFAAGCTIEDTEKFEREFSQIITESINP